MNYKFIRLIPFCPKYGLIILYHECLFCDLRVPTTYINFYKYGPNNNTEIFESSDANIICLKAIKKFMDNIHNNKLYFYDDKGNPQTTQQNFIVKQYKYIIKEERVNGSLEPAISCVLKMDIEADLTQFLNSSENHRLHINKDYIVCKPNNMPGDFESNKGPYPEIELVDCIEYKN